MAPDILGVFFRDDAVTELQAIPLKTIDGRDATLGDFDGQVLLVVNTASKCGLTPQYEALQALHTRYKARGFSVLGFPANDFGAQEPGTEAEIQAFCSTSYDVDFPLFSKITVVGEAKHPLYAALTRAQPRAQGAGGWREKLAGYGMTPNPEPEVLWNFEKFLISRRGDVVARFSPDMVPSDDRIVSAVEQELAAGA